VKKGVIEQPDVSFDEDGALWLRWPAVLLIVDKHGFGYAIHEHGRYRAGRHEDWEKASQEIREAIA
jgi:hypothetical protein